MKFVDIKNDIAFRKIFGNENKKVILISFLNAVLGLEGDARITWVEIMNPFQMPIIKNMKSSIVDLRVRDGKDNAYVVEMQVSEPEGLDKRLLYYSSKEYVKQIETGEQYPKLKPVIFIGIFDFRFSPSGKYISHHAICDVESGDRLIKDMDFFFIELPKFQKALHEITTIQDKWIYFIKEAKNIEMVPDNVDDEGLAAAYHDAAKFNWTPLELDEYDYAAMREQDERGIKALAVRRAEEKGMEVGMEKGMEVGMEKGKETALLELVVEMHAEGLAIDRIAKIAKISVEAVKEMLGKKGLDI